MRSPDDRKLLVQALNPPIGYDFDTGIATTFSLQPEALIAAPLHLSWLAHGKDSELPDDPIRLLEGLRRVASRFTVFSDAGRMHLPVKSLPLAGMLEDMIHEVRAPNKGAFHPKVWLLRFVSESVTDEPVKLRLLILSRNMTFDRSWDLCLCLEGTPGKRRVADNRPLRELLAALPGMKALGGRELSSSRAEQVRTLIQDLERTTWELPPGFDTAVFVTLGMSRKGSNWFPPDGDDLLVISPFVTGGALLELAKRSRVKPLLISRADELDALQEDVLNHFREVYVLNDLCDKLEEGDDSDHREVLQGLHAKAYIVKMGWDASHIVGSANATSAALQAGSNVEFLCELRGKASKVGAPAVFLEPDSLGKILVPYVPSERTLDSNEEDAKKQMEVIQQAIADMDLRAICAIEEGGTWSLSLTGIGFREQSDCFLTTWPVSLVPERAIEFDSSGTAKFTHLAAAEITSLFGFRIQIGRQVLTFARAVVLEGVPPDRDAEILARVLRNPQGFLRYLRLLLEDLQGHEGGEGLPPWMLAGQAGQGLAEETPFFEMLVKAYSRQPSTLKAVEDVISRLESSSEQSGIIPSEFKELWEVFRSALKEVAT